MNKKVITRKNVNFSGTKAIMHKALSWTMIRAKFR